MGDLHIQRLQKCQLCLPIILLLPVIMSCYKLDKPGCDTETELIPSSLPISLGPRFSLCSLNNNSHPHSFLHFSLNFALQHFLSCVQCSIIQGACFSFRARSNGVQVVLGAAGPSARGTVLPGSAKNGRAVSKQGQERGKRMNK